MKRHGNTVTIGYKGHLDPPCNLIQEKTFSKRLSPLAFLLLNNVRWQGLTVMDWQSLQAEQYPLVFVTELFKLKDT
jgi:hypothetical protein